MLCSCCNRPVDPKFAKDHNYCPVCWSAECTPAHPAHDESNLKIHYDEKDGTL